MCVFWGLLQGQNIVAQVPPQLCKPICCGCVLHLNACGAFPNAHSPRRHCFVCVCTIRETHRHFETRPKATHRCLSIACVPLVHTHFAHISAIHAAVYQPGSDPHKRTHACTHTHTHTFQLLMLIIEPPFHYKHTHDTTQRQEKVYARGAVSLGFGALKRRMCAKRKHTHSQCAV